MQSGKADTLYGLQIPVDPLIQYHLYGPPGENTVVEGSYT
jgi:hypothetical protein